MPDDILYKKFKYFYGGYNHAANILKHMNFSDLVYTLNSESTDCNEP
jgi:hypothetical protein